jgi:hypothetical protein
MTPAEIVNLAVTAINGILSLAQALGQRDAVIEALDAALAAARAKTDRDLDAKHHARDSLGSPRDPLDR